MAAGRESSCCAVALFLLIASAYIATAPSASGGNALRSSSLRAGDGAGAAGAPPLLIPGLPSLSNAPAPPIASLTALEVPDDALTRLPPLEHRLSSGITHSKPLNVCKPRPVSRHIASERARTERRAATRRTVAGSSAAFAWPECPPFVAPPEDNADAHIDRRTDYVTAKYVKYAARCNATDGVMWRKLTRPAHDAIFARVAQFLGLRDVTRRRRQTQRGDGATVRVLDWASGCGAALPALRRASAEENAASEDESLFRGWGVDLTAAAVDWAKARFEAPDGGRHFRYCRADGTTLAPLLRADSFDAVVAFGGLLHLPRPRMCSTLATLLRSLRVGGVLWGGYIDAPDTVTALRACRFACEEDGGGVLFMTVEENDWFSGLGMPKSNRKLKPVSVLWHKLQAVRLSSIA